MTLTHGDLFSGIGGFALAASWMGWDTRYFVEINEYARTQLARNFKGVPIYGDVRTMGWEKALQVDVLTAGFPCQPVSAAGRGDGENDVRWLWPEVARAIRLLRPRFVVLENVPGLLRRNAGREMRAVLGDLAKLGYDAEWQVVSAAEVGAPHLRHRVWIVGYPRRRRRAGITRRGTGPQLANGHSPVEGHGSCSEGDRAMADAHGDGRSPDAAAEGRKAGHARGRAERRARGESVGGGAEVADTNGQSRAQGRSRHGTQGKGRRHADRSRQSHRANGRVGAVESDRRKRGVAADRQAVADAHGPGSQGRGITGDGQRAAERSERHVTASCCDGAHGDGFAGHWRVEPGVGRVADGIPNRVARIEALGNAIVPQVLMAWAYPRVMELVAEGR